MRRIVVPASNVSKRMLSLSTLGSFAQVTVGHDGSVVLEIDDDAAGLAWFMDDTPSDDSEFTLIVSNSQLRADADSPAKGRVDLLTVLMHELGHVLGLPDVPESELPYRIMATPLAPGVRRLPTAADFEWLQARATVTSDGTAMGGLVQTPRPGVFVDALQWNNVPNVVSVGCSTTT